MLLNTPLGKIQEGAPIVFQNGKQLKARWIIDKQTLSFNIENYNPNQELIIDPVTRVWGTFYGYSNDEGKSCSTDASGNVFMAGIAETNIGTVIATTGSHQSSLGGGTDAFLVKFNSSGVRQWGTYYGSTGNEAGNSCAADVNGNIYMAGSSFSSASNILATIGSHQSVYGGGTSDAFLVKFNSSGVRQWGTYYGDVGPDLGNACTLDPSGNVYLAGKAGFGTNITTAGAHQINGTGNGDPFLVKFNSSGVRQWGTYHGGGAIDEATSCATDASGNVYRFRALALGGFAKH